MSEPVTLASLLGGHIAVEWFEAVALVREVAERLIEDANPSRLVPELHQVRLSPEGRVDVTGGQPSDEPVRRLGQLLQALLANSDAPVQLRLVISQATAAKPLYGSIREYSEALGFFERPERSMVLQALASRAAAAPASTGSQKELTLDSIAPLPKGERVKKEQPKRAVSPQSKAAALRFAGVAAVVVLVCAGGAWYAWKRGIGPRSGTDASAIANRAGDAVGTALVSGASAVTERLGLGRIVPTNVPGSEMPVGPPAPAPAPLPKTPPVKGQPEDPNPPSDSVPPLFAFDLDPVPGAEGPPVAVPPEARPSALSAGESRSSNDRGIYTVGSEGVIPPVGIRPQLARQLPPDLDRDNLGRIELIIGPDGSVESAKLLTPPRTVRDGLFLSVAKAWSFRPALKDGVAVRYRKTIWIASP